jgi:hypothetical protein
MLANFDRVSNVIPVSQLQATGRVPVSRSRCPSGRSPGVEVHAGAAGRHAALDNLDDQSFVLVRRRLEKDALQLVSIGKELSFR